MHSEPLVLIETNAEIRNVSGGIRACWRAWVARCHGLMRGPRQRPSGSTCRWLRTIGTSKGYRAFQVLTVHENWQIREEGAVLFGK